MSHFSSTLSRRRSIIALAGAAVLPASVLGQTERTVRLIVASSAGSTIDVIARTAESALAGALGSPLVIENIAGAGSVIAMRTLARATPDGSVLALQTNNMVTAPLLMKSAPYDAVNDFTPIAVIGSIPLALVVNASKVAATNAKEFIDLIKGPSGSKLNYGSSGLGTTLHLAVEVIQEQVGVKLNHVPYKGVAPMINELVGGQIDFAVTALPPVQQHIRSGALRAIGLLTSQRVSVAPEIPSFAEQGFRQFDLSVWMAVLGPKGMAPPTVKRVHDAVSAAFTGPGVREALEKQGNVIRVSSPGEALTLIRQDVAKYSALAQKINLLPE